MSVHPITLATIRKHLAEAELTLARLESREAAYPVLKNTSNARLSLARQITEARKILGSWESVERGASA